jgi:hypothetical protein
MQDRPIQKAIFILQHTEDGNQLTQEHLRLVELAAQDNLNATGLERLEALHAAVANGTYQEPDSLRCLCGIPNLRQDAAGYVYWKNKSIEHYSFQSREAMCKAATALAETCLALEAKGFPVTARTVLGAGFREAPAGTPWLEAMQSYYTLHEGEGRYAAVFYAKTDSNQAFTLERSFTTGEVSKKTFEPDETHSSGVIAASRHLETTQNLKAVTPSRSYERISKFFENSGLSAQDIHNALADS